MAIITSAGAIPSSPTELLNAEIAAATALSPGLTATLPGSLVEDMASTAAGAVVLQDQAFVDLVNSVSPYTANAFMLYQLGAVYGVQQGQGSNTSVYVTFTGLPGFVIPVGFTVSDGTYQYTVQDGGVIGTGGQSTALYCLATVSGTWAIPVGTVTQIITSVPTGFTLTCTNLTSGLPGASAQSLADYQAQVIQAGQAVAQGMPTFLRTQIQNVSGVQPRLVSIRQTAGNWEILCEGGDPYQVANAIFTGLFDINDLTGSILNVTAITNAYPAVVTTSLNHGYTTGQTVQINGETGMSNVNGNNFVATVLTQNTFALNVTIASMAWSGGVVQVTTATPHGLPTGTSTGTISGVTPSAYNGTYTFTQVNSTKFTYVLAANPGVVTTQGYTGFNSVSQGAWVSGGVVTPNLRNQTVSLISYPDTYVITYVIPLEQTVAVNLTWNTISPNFVSSTAVANVAAPAIAAYINSIPTGQPINVFDLQSTFEASVSSLIPVSQISKMQFTVTINGVATNPNAGTGVIYGDSESYFTTTSASVIITQG